MMAKENSGAGRPALTATEAFVYVSDFARARDYYVAKLGFTLEVAYGDPPFFGLLVRNAARLCLRLVSEPVFAGNIREREQLLSAAFALGSAADVEGLSGEFGAAGADIVHVPRTEPWGARTFIIRDPDGNLVLFAAPAD